MEPLEMIYMVPEMKSSVRESRSGLAITEENN